MKAGIYKITNVVNGKCYIGSSINIKSRFGAHRCELNGNRHSNSHFQNAWNKYRENSFIFEVLLYCDKENLMFFEQGAINYFKSLDGENGYNVCPAQETRLTGSNARERARKLSIAHIGKKCSQKTKKKMSEAQKGRKHTETTKKKLSEIHKGKKLTDKTKKKLSEIQKHKRRGAKAVIIKGKYYQAILDATQELGVGQNTVARRINAKRLGYNWA